MWEEFFTDLSDNAVHVFNLAGSWLDQHLLNILIILAGAYLLRKFGTKLIIKLLHKTIRRDLYPTELDRKKRLQTLDSLTGAGMRVFAWLIASFMIISELGIDTTPLLASASVFGLAIGIGAQSLVKDFVSGVFIISENQYRVGDAVEIGDVDGVVEAITIRTTIIRDLDGDLHHVPNGSITVTTNKTMDFGSINEDVVVARDTDLKALEHIINHVGERLVNEPSLKGFIVEAPYFSQIKGYDKDGIVVKILGKTTAGDSWKVRSELYRHLTKAFKQHDVVVPYGEFTIHQTKKK